MDIQEYSRRFIHFYEDAVPALLAEQITDDLGSFMDVGCGDGNLLQALAARGMLEGKRVYAVDISPQRIQAVQQACPDFECLVAGAEHLEGIANGEIDLLATTQVIEHVSDDAEMVAEIARVVKPGGAVYLSTVFKKPWAWYFRRCNGRWALDPTHLREYQHDSELLDVLEKAGLEPLANRKTLICYSLMDPLMRLLKVKRSVFLRSRVLRALRRIKLPILGYYVWELVLRNRGGDS